MTAAVPLIHTSKMSEKVFDNEYLLPLHKSFWIKASLMLFAKINNTVDKH